MSSHSDMPEALPARKDAFAGYHIRRTPGPLAGMLPVPNVPEPEIPPPLTLSCPSCTDPAAKPPLPSRCTSVFGVLSGVPFAPPAAAVVWTLPSGNLKPPAVEAITPSAVK